MVGGRQPPVVGLCRLELGSLFPAERYRTDMVGFRSLTAMVGLAVSVLASVALWWYFDTFAFLLFLPFVPFLFRSGRDEVPEPRECPDCGFRSRNDAYDYCPRDGTRLER